MISIEQLTKVYGHGAKATVVLDRLDFRVDAAEIFAVVGPSGAGKSTLAQCVNLLERPTSGSVLVNGENLSQLGERQLRAARRRIGTIFQSDGLYSRRTAAQNVALPLEYLGVTTAEAKRRVAELLDRVGLSDRAGHYPHQLSGGQRQRVGIARALALRPQVLLSDEATSGLDPESTASIVSLLKELRDDLDLSILFITHEMDTVLQVADAVARLDHGHIVESGRIVDLLRDPASALGRALRPARPHATPQLGETHWFVSYTSGAVPADWVLRLASELDAPVSVLGASIETVAGQTVGHANIGVRAVEPALLVETARRLGLDARPVPEDPEAAALADRSAEESSRSSDGGRSTSADASAPAAAGDTTPEASISSTVPALERVA
ncbi:ATP-binding cassette domain-containing protein [Cryobacterium levicorallinum]|uniref:ABC-type methionine transport system, ATPase component n=1 Tax=Cryobacterium levicorallinum TaxID=995038 RepID=A0A1I2Y6C0_9MICO|nr:ATP-binding cassette domain-containing protein [Cryobacterium levicorallinum]TFB85183.1 ATP-binding cassette domain-containing protein [Cryobacterium levicorallinum]GEP27454.1 methionine import ATP-binding protein MetN [Cryobacterium levicorallinum]SFH21213.1 ABC-type methionine transport system, ATPase component [Cryobacterium levicorallinum]